MTDNMISIGAQKKPTDSTDDQKSGSVTNPEVARIPRDYEQWKLRAARFASILVALIVWEISGQFIDKLFLASPSEIVVAAWNMILSGELREATASSFRSLIQGFLLASVIGISLGLLIGRYRLVGAAVNWIVNALYAMPLVSVIPLVILWFGLGAEAKLFIVTLFAFFPVVINTAAGVQNVPREFIDVGDSFASTERQIFVKIILPAALPYVVTGLRLAAGRALIAMIIAEFFTAITGLGALIMKYEEQFDTASMFVPIIMLSILGVLLMGAIGILERRIAPWKAA